MLTLFMHLTLLVPGLLLPLEILENTVHDLRAPALSSILGSGVRQPLPADWLADAFGLDHLPAAALRKVSPGGTAPGEWLCLDPVRWQVSHEGVTLDDPARLELTAAEAAALIEAVAPLFADWGEFSTSAPVRWELQLKRPLALEILPLPTSIQQAIDPRLPEFLSQKGLDIIEHFKRMAEETGIPYQNLINLYLSECAHSGKKLALKWAS